MRSASDCAGAYAPAAAKIAARWSGGALRGNSTARTISSACTTSELLRIVVARPADLDALILLVLISACHFGSGGPSATSFLAAGALARVSPPAAPAAASSASFPAHGAGPATSLT